MGMPRAGLWAVAVVVIASSALGGDAKRPKLTLRVVPQSGPPSTDFVFVGILKGGADTRELYCPTLDWQWGPQDTSVQEQECPPFEAGVTRIERRFSASRRLDGEGERTVTLVLRNGDKLVARASVSFRVTWEKKPPTATFQGPGSDR